MKIGSWSAQYGLLAVALCAGLTACSPGDLSFSNEGPTDVTIRTGEETFSVSADGGVLLLGSGCRDADITVEFPSGPQVVVPGPVCPDERVVIRDGRVDVVP